MDSYGQYNMSTGSDGTFTGASAPSALQVFVVVPASASCIDSFTGLPLPFSLAGIMYQPSASSASATVTPVTKLLQYATATSSENPVVSSYAMVAVNATNAQAGALSALRQSSTAVRLTGVRMLLADVSLSSLVVTAAAALAAFPAGTIPACSTQEARVNAVYNALALRASASPINLSSSSLFNSVLSDAASVYCKAAPATMTVTAVTSLLSQATLLYQAAVSSLAVNDTVLAEMLMLPVEALSLASRVAYVVQANGPDALAALSNNPQATQQLVAGWAILLSAAPVKLAAMGFVLGATTTPADLHLTLRSTGALAACKVSLRNIYQAGTAMTAVTDDKGAVNLTNVVGPMVIVPSGCRDTVLSRANNTVATVIPLPVLMPLGVESVSIDVVSALATAVYFASASAATWTPHHIAAADFAAIYNFFGIGLPGAADALPAGADYVRQNWNASHPIATRTYLLNLRVAAVLGPTSTFIAGFLGNGSSPDTVARALLTVLAQDLLAGNIKLDDSNYLSNAMLVYIQAHQGRRRSLAATLSLDQLTQLLATVASTVSQSTAMLTQLDAQVASAAAAGSPIDASVVLRSAAQVASVQQTTMSAALTQIAAAAAAGDTAALQSLTTAFTSDFTGSALQAQVQSAAIDSSALNTMLSGGVNATDASSSGDAGAGVAAAVGGKSSNVALIAGCTVGIVGGAMLVGAAAAVMVLRRQSAHVVPAHPRHQDAPPAGAVAEAADIERGAPSRSAWAPAPASAAAPAPAAAAPVVPPLPLAAAGIIRG